MLDAVVATTIADPCLVLPFSPHILARISVVRMLF
jgi:hypothetical protein